jgi:hypothetical protein
VRRLAAILPAGPGFDPRLAPAPNTPLLERGAVTFDLRENGQGKRKFMPAFYQNQFENAKKA